MLEGKISAALTAADITASELLALAGETDSAIIAADELAGRERAKALDPTLSPDPVAAREKMEAAQFAAARLRTVLPRLHAKHEQVEAAEYARQWEKDYQAVEGQTARLAQELADFYPPMVKKLVDLFDRMAANENACSRVAQGAPPGEHRRIVGAEQRARGHWAVGYARLAEKVALPAWEENRAAWPRPSSITALFAPPAHPGDRWAEFNGERAEAVRREHARAIDYYDTADRERSR